MCACNPPPILQAIPDPQEVQRLLAQVYREADLLRGLLRLAKRKRQAQERECIQQQKGDGHVA